MNQQFPEGSRPPCEGAPQTPPAPALHGKPVWHALGPGRPVPAPAPGRPASAPPPFRPAAPLPAGGSDRLLALCAFLLGYVYVKWIFFAPYREHGFGITLFTAFFVASVEGFCRFQRLPAPGESRFWGCVTLLLGLSFSLYGNHSLLGWPLAALTASAVYWTLARAGALAGGGAGPLLPVDAWNGFVQLPLGNFFCRCRVLLARPKEKTSACRWPALLAGLALGLPLVLWAAFELAMADAAFEALARGLLHAVNLSSFMEFLLYLLFSLPVGAYLFGLVYGAAHRRHLARPSLEQAGKAAASVRRLPVLTAGTALSLLALLYLLFFVVQAGYLFSAFGNTLPEGYTAAEYARRGFFELCRLCCLNLGVLGLAQLFCRRSLKEHTVLRRLALALCVESLLLVVTALSKMGLYISRFGLTPLRLNTSCFMLFLLAALVMVALALFRPLRLIRCVLLTGAALYCVLCLSNADGLIARVNVGRYLASPAPSIELLDTETLLQCREGAIPALVELYERTADSTARKELYALIFYRRYERSWRWHNLQSLNAHALQQGVWAVSQEAGEGGDEG